MHCFALLESSDRMASGDSTATSKSSLGSFRQQLDYLLTPRERSQLKKTLQIYADKR